VNNREFFRPRGSAFAAYIAYLLLAGMALQSLITDGFTAGLNATAWCTLIGLAIYITLHRPAIEIFDEGVRIFNPLNTIVVGWQDVDVVEAKYTAFLQLRDRRKISIWCAQTPGRYHSRTVHSSEVRGLQLDGFIRPGESPRTDSGVATYLCRSRLAAFRASEASSANGARDGLGYLSLRENWLITALVANALIIALFAIFHA
jgi:hypothetical protein